MTTDSLRHFTKPGGRGAEVPGLLPRLSGAPVDDDPGCGPIDQDTLERLRLLVSTVESQVIPRLVSAHRPGVTTAASAAVQAPPRDEDVARCVGVLLDPSGGSVAAFAEELLDRGVTLETIYLQIFAPSARELGEMWNRDECSFVDVTIAVGRLQQALRGFASHFCAPGAESEPWRRALFAAAPGEQHTLGLSMIVQYFLREGWDVSLVASDPEEALLRLVQQESVTLVGLSMSDPSHAAALKAIIARVRAGSKNPAIRVMVGGHAFDGNDALAATVGADGVAVDAQQAVNLAQQMVS